MADIPQVGLPDTYEPQDPGGLGSQVYQNEGEQLEGAANQLVYTARYLSKTQMINQTASFNGAVNDARASIYANPSNENIAAQQAIIAQNAQTSQQVDLLGRDQAQLSKNVQETQDAFNIEAAQYIRKNNNAQLAMNFQTNLQPMLQTIHENAANGKLDLANANATALLENAKNLTASGALTPDAYNKIAAMTNTIVSRGTFLNQNFNNSDAVQINTAKELGLMPSTNQTNPQDQTSNALTNSYLNASNLTDAKSAAINGVLSTPFLTDPKTSDSDFQQVMQTYHGAAMARAEVASGLNYTNLATKVQYLSKEQGLTGQQEGYRSALINAQNGIKNDFFNYYTTQTSNGRDAIQNLNDTISNISTSPLLTPQAKQQYAFNAQAQFANNVLAFAHAHQIPMQYVKPFPENDSSYQAIQGAFLPNGQVDKAISILQSKNPVVPYYINSLSTPTQQEAAHLVSMTNDVGASSLLLNANQNQDQEKVPSAIIDEDGKAIKDNKILLSLSGNDNYKNYLSLVGSMPGGTSRIGAIQKALVNTVKYCMQSNSANTLSNCVDKVSAAMPDASTYSSGSLKGGSYQFLASQFPTSVSPQDQKGLAQYALNQAYAKIKNSLVKSGINKFDVQLKSQAIVNGLKVVNTPAKTLLVFNPNTGQDITEIPVDSHTLALGRINNKSEINPVLRATFGDMNWQNFSGE